LLLVLGKLQVSEQTFSSATSSLKKDEIISYIQKAKKGEQVPVKFVIQLTAKNPFYKLAEFETLSSVVEILGTGVHRVAIVNESSTKITGILSQRRLIKYLWDNARRFASLEPLFQSTLVDLGIGNSKVISIFGDEPLINALVKMNVDKISSIAVVDHHFNLLGNISVTDVKHVTKSSQSALLHKSCLHFISIILNHRGIEDGKDSFPIFHVYPTSSLGRTVAKLVATKSHRLWVVQPYLSQSVTSTSSISSNTESPIQPLLPEAEGRAGKLIGVVSLTDILGLIARKHGKFYVDPNQARKQRRRSSSSSTRSSTSLEQFRRSISGASDLR
jgi:CBS domain-containing protein